MSLQILLVEPERHAREGLQAILAAEGHVVSGAHDLASGLARLVDQRVDLLLLDADVAPSFDVRLSVLDLLRLALRGAASTRAILITSDLEVLQAVDAPRVVTVLEKPVDPSRLRHALRAAASGQEWSSEL